MSAAILFAAGLAIRATLLIGAAWAGAAMLRRAGASAAARHMAWLFGIGALLALPILWWLAPPLPLPILAPETARAAGTVLPSAAPASPGGPGWAMLLLAAYAIGVAALLLRFAASRFFVERLWRAAAPARGADWRDLLAEVSGEMRLPRPVALRIARGPAMPMTWGTLAPKVLLPAEAASWPAERRRLVLLHELAHVARRDSLARSAATIACALYWFHPGAWFAARRMRLEQEHAADDRVLNAGAAARSYAMSLLELARRAGETRWPDHVAAMAGMCQLEQRVVSITTAARRERPGPAFLSASATIAAFVIMTVAAGLPVRPMADMPDPLPIGAALPSPRPVSGLAETIAEDEARVADGTAIIARADGRTRDPGDSNEAARDVAPPVRADARAPEPVTQQAAPAAQGDEAAPRQEAAAAVQQLGAYGPRLPQPIAAEQETDPRIPAALRGGGAGRTARIRDQWTSAAPPGTREINLQIWPRIILSAR